MKLFRFSLVTLCLVAASLANAQSNDVSMAGVSGTVPTLDCGSNQIKVGSSCAMLLYPNVSENSACAAAGAITLGATSDGRLLSCQSGSWKRATGPQIVQPPVLSGNGCASAGGVKIVLGQPACNNNVAYSAFVCANGTLDYGVSPGGGGSCSGW